MRLFRGNDTNNLNWNNIDGYQESRLVKKANQLAFCKLGRGFELKLVVNTSKLVVRAGPVDYKSSAVACGPHSLHNNIPGEIYMFLYMVKVSKSWFCLLDGNETDLYNSKH